MEKGLNTKELEALKSLRNHLMHNGRFPTMRELMQDLGYKSPRSAALLIDQLLNKGVLKKNKNGFHLVENTDNGLIHAQTVDIPLLGEVACGVPILAQENILAMIPVSTRLASPPNKYYLLKAKGDSMNEAGINHGDLVLVRHQVTADNGDVVVAMIDDSATIKEFHKTSNTIVLKPKSSNKNHRPIVLTSDFLIQGKVITTIPDIY